MNGMMFNSIWPKIDLFSFGTRVMIFIWGIVFNIFTLQKFLKLLFRTVKWMFNYGIPFSFRKKFRSQCSILKI
jgi:hypothetical protein